MFWFEWTDFGNTQVVGLSGSEFIELYSDLGEVQAGYFLIQVLG
jgi:hypothetical protein